MKTAYGWVEGVNLTSIGIKVPGFWCALAKRPTEKELQDMIDYKGMGRSCIKIIIQNESEPAPEKRPKVGRI